MLASSQKENRAAYKLIGTVLRRTSAAIQIPVTKFINNVLVGEGVSRSGGSKSSELADHVYPLIYELHRISKDLLADVFPGVTTQLQLEDEHVRLKAAMLLGKLYASPFANYAVDFPRDFRAYLGRFQDLSPDIRREAIRGSCDIGNCKPELQPQMEGQSLSPARRSHPSLLTVRTQSR